MLSTLLRPQKRRADKSPLSSPYTSSPLAARNNGQQVQAREHADDYDEDEDEDEDDDEDDGGDDTPLLPIFSAAHLGL
jgi:hypothetical protein